VFQPYLAPVEAFPLGPDPLSCTATMSGGNHLRDLDGLRRAIAGVAAQLRHDVHVYSGEPGLLASPRFQPQGLASFSDFWRAIQHSRCVVVPLADVPSKAAGVTVVTMALAAGRPVIASNIAAARDYLRDGVDSLLVPPGDAEALGAALLRLDRDDALLAHLAAGARETRERLSAARWASTLLAAPEPRTELRPW
jgi:glycosyltransferase involved in cell wall biosynthesis